MNLLLKEVRHNPMLWLLAFVPVVFAAGECYRPVQGALPEMQNRPRGEDAGMIIERSIAYTVYPSRTRQDGL